MKSNRFFDFRSPRALSVTVGAILLLVLFVQVLVQCDGRFTYSLDDPYIHLSLAREVARGHYGLQAGEVAAPSSSILWPFLLAPWSFTPLFELAPLLLNVVFSLLTMTTVVACYGEIFRDEPNPRQRSLKIFGWSLVTVLTANGIAVVFTGMEHSLQIWLTVIAAHGLIRIYRGESIPPSLPIALAIAPLVRYENLALTLGACAFLFLCRKRAAALASAAVPIILIVAFSLFLKAQGLGIFPSSVMAKSPSLAKLGGILPPDGLASVAAGAGHAGVASIGHTLIESVLGKLRDPHRVAYVVFVVIAIVFGFQRQNQRAMALWGVLAFALLAHLIVGDAGWFQRYQMYLYAGGTILLVFLRHQNPVVPLPWSKSALRVVPIGLFFLFIGGQSLRTLYITNRASASVYVQQHQMMRFVRDFYREPCAVNDLGEVAFGAGQYVLDLWGLASRDALAARLTSHDKMDWVGPIVDQHKIGIVMIYPGWFPVKPATWKLVGRLNAGIPTAAVGAPTVSFFVTKWGDEASIREKLADFGTTLPAGASIDVVGN